MDDLTKLPNIGNVLKEQLRQAGITSPAELKQVGSKEAWKRIRENDPSACYMRLCSLQGAISGVRWHDLPESIKADLKLFYEQQKGR
jgi:DNA transformation protein